MAKSLCGAKESNLQPSASNRGWCHVRTGASRRAGTAGSGRATPAEAHRPPENTIQTPYSPGDLSHSLFVPLRTYDAAFRFLRGLDLTTRDRPCLLAYARARGLPPSSFLCQFARVGLRRPGRVLAALRLRRAIARYVAGATGDDVAYTLGYSSAQALGRTCRDLTGHTLTQWRAGTVAA